MHPKGRKPATRKKSEQKIVICVCGMAGCGKSTVSKRLARKYGLKYFSGGDALKDLAIEKGYKAGGAGWWETQEGEKFLQERTENPDFDNKVDEKLLERAERGNVVLDSWTMPWLLKEGFKVWLEVSPHERAKRIAKRDRISYRKALEALMEKDEKTKAIYKSLYGFNLGEDLSPFNLVLDTNNLKANEVFHILRMIIDRLYIKKPENRASTH